MDNFDRTRIDEENFASLIKLIPLIKEYHSPESPFYKFFYNSARNISNNLFGPNSQGIKNIGELGSINFPYFNMGAINSTDLFGFDELILFSFYLHNKNNYKKVADLGANIGLHSIILSNLGYQVTSYEPDIIHFEKLRENIELNSYNYKPRIINKAISNVVESVDFIRVKGNTTGSHIKGAKESPYGDLEVLKVETDALKDIIPSFDFLKIDVEGHEAKILTSTSHNDWLDTDAMIEVGTEKNAQLIYEFFKSNKINLFSQKNSWSIVNDFDDMPCSYKDGSLFVSNKNTMPW